LLDGVPVALPALSQAREHQDRAGRVDFDWPKIEGMLENRRFMVCTRQSCTMEESRCRIRVTGDKFKKRLAYIEQGAKKNGRNLSTLSVDEMESL